MHTNWHTISIGSYQKRHTYWNTILVGLHKKGTPIDTLFQSMLITRRNSRWHTINHLLDLFHESWFCFVFYELAHQIGHCPFFPWRGTISLILTLLNNINNQGHIVNIQLTKVKRHTNGHGHTNHIKCHWYYYLKWHNTQHRFLLYFRQLKDDIWLAHYSWKALVLNTWYAFFIPYEDTSVCVDYEKKPHSQ